MSEAATTEEALKEHFDEQFAGDDEKADTFRAMTYDCGGTVVVD